MQKTVNGLQLVNGVVIQLMAVDGITDSNLKNVFVHKYLHQPPPIPKMKGGIFIPVTSDDGSDNSTVTELSNY